MLEESSASSVPYLTAVVVVVFFSAVSAHPLDHHTEKESIIPLLDIACEKNSYICPKPEFGNFSKVGNYFNWNDQAVNSAPEADLIRAGLISRRRIFGFVRNRYCCTEGPCLSNCGIHEIREIDLIKEFPKNVDLLFKLDFPGLEDYRETVFSFIEENSGKHIRPPFPAEIEEFFDFLHEHQRSLSALYRDAVLRKHLADKYPLK